MFRKNILKLVKDVESSSRKLGRKKRSTWVRLEKRMEDWWKKMPSDDVSGRFWKKKL